MFDDLLSANLFYQARYHDPKVTGVAGRGLAVVTCIDSRIDPLSMLGLRPGDAKIIRNAGARVTQDVLRSLTLAVHFLGVERICVVQHTDCAMASRSNEEIVASLEGELGIRSDWDFLTMTDQKSELAGDLRRIRECDLIPEGIGVGGFIFDVTTGGLSKVV